MTRPPALHRHVLHPSLAGKLCPTLYVFPLYLHAEKIQGECWAFVWTLTVLLLFKGILYKRKQCSCWILKHCFDYRNKEFETNDMYLKLVFLLCSVFVFAFIEYNLYFYALTINAYRGFSEFIFLDEQLTFDASFSCTCDSTPGSAPTRVTSVSRPELLSQFVDLAPVPTC